LDQRELFGHECTCQIQKYWKIWSVALARSVQDAKNEKRLRLKKSIMKLLNYQISCYGVLPSVGGTNFRPKLYVYLIVSFSSSSFLSTYHPPIYFPGCNILAPIFPNTYEFDKCGGDGGVYNNAAECSFARVGCRILGKGRSWRKTITRENTNASHSHAPRHGSGCILLEGVPVPATLS